jgi:hypothetical protein
VFICRERCIQKYEGPAVQLAIAFGPASFGACEVCREVGHCYDIWSGNPNWWLKGKKPPESGNPQI